MKKIKYYAGLFDADGSFDLDPTKRNNGNYYVNIRATLYQKDKTVLEELGSYYDVDPTSSKGCWCLALRGKNAFMFMQEVKKYLVIKKNVVEYLLTLKGITVEDLKLLRLEVRKHRESLSPEKDYPSRQWMAGYVDGDGCILSSYRKSDGNLEFKLSVTSHVSQTAGLELMQKAFGGQIISQQDIRRWNISLSMTKGKQLFTFFGKHLKMKKSQADLVLDCLRSKKHFRKNGATRESNLKLHRRLQELKLPATTKSPEQKFL